MPPILLLKVVASCAVSMLPLPALFPVHGVLIIGDGPMVAAEVVEEEDVLEDDVLEDDDSEDDGIDVADAMVALNEADVGNDGWGRTLGGRVSLCEKWEGTW